MNHDIIATAIASADHSTLVTAVKAAGLVETLQSSGPFTVFAPTNAAFANLPAGTVETLLKAENKDQLSSVLTYHVVAGKVMAADLLNMIGSGDGEASFATVAGGMLKAAVVDGKVMLTDAQGNSAEVTAADLDQSNGVIHVVNAVLLP